MTLHVFDRVVVEEEGEGDAEAPGSASPRASISISGSAPRAASATARGVASRPSAEMVPTWGRPPQLQLAIRI